MGREAVPLWVIDEAHPDPEALVAQARERSFARNSDDLYPGERAAAPDGYSQWLCSLIVAVTGLSSARILRSAFAIANRDPATLSPIQRVPHFDDCAETVLAAVHYLCAPPHGGTSFYRHRLTGFERISRARVVLWQQGIVADGARYGLPPRRYHDGDTAAFEQIGKVDLRFNRLVLYPANCLHSGDVGEFWNSDWPDGARLTATSLVSV